MNSSLRCHFRLLANDSPKPRPSLAPRQINSAQKQCQFLVTEHHLGLPAHRLRPTETALLQTLVAPFEMQVMRSQPRVLCG
jgi:hypothetical protein